VLAKFVFFLSVRYTPIDSAPGYSGGGRQAVPGALVELARDDIAEHHC
jgi:hypothetical protein